MTREEISSNIEKLSELRAKYNCFDEKEESFYHALSLGIKGIKALEQELCEDVTDTNVGNMDLISRQALKEKLQEHHDFFVNAYGGFSNLPPNDKARVDEITNCIAMVVNEPSVTPAKKQEPKYCDRNICMANEYNGIGCAECEVTKSQETKTGHWIDTGSGQECSECGEIQYGYDSFRHFCANCGSRMEVCDATDN